jgi:hypothetical protein
VTEPKKGGISANPARIAAKALRQASVKNTQEKDKAGKSSSKIPNPTTPMRPPQHTQSSIEEMSDLLDTLPIDAYVELTAAPILPSGAGRSRAVLKMVVVFVAEYGSTA